MRLDKYLHDVGFGTRKDIDRLLRNGRVTINGETTRRGKRTVAAGDVVCVDGEKIDYEPQVTIMLNKPAGVVSATFDPQEQTVLDLLPERFAHMKVAPVGRLDKDTTGLLLLTNDGAYNHRLTHPRSHVPKTYFVCYSGQLPPDAEQRCAQGIALSDFTTAPAQLERLEKGSCRLTISEGKFHQVKRMLGALGCKVTALKRERIGGLALDQDLALGQWRSLRAGEKDAALEREE